MSESYLRGYILNRWTLFICKPAYGEGSLAALWYEAAAVRAHRYAGLRVRLGRRLV